MVSFSFLNNNKFIFIDKPEVQALKCNLSNYKHKNEKSDIMSLSAFLKSKKIFFLIKNFSPPYR